MLITTFLRAQNRRKIEIRMILLLNQKLIQNGPVWRSPGEISEEDKIEIIQTGLKVYF